VTHSPGNARAKGKLERWNRSFPERVIGDGQCDTIGALDQTLQEWNRFYKERHHHRAINCTPATRLRTHRPRSLPHGSRPLLDICALLETRKVNKDHSISVAGVSYVLPREPNLVAFTVEVRIRPGERGRVWHQDRLVADLAHGEPARPDGLSVEQILEKVLPQLEPKGLRDARGETSERRPGRRPAGKRTL